MYYVCTNYYPNILTCMKKNNKTSIPADTLEKLREKMPINWRQEAPEFCGCSISYIEKHLYGQRCNIETLNKIVEYIKYVQYRDNSTIKLIENL